MTLIRSLLLAMCVLVLPGCMSYSTKAAAELDHETDAFTSAECQNSRQNAGIHDSLKNIKLVASSSLMLIAGPVMAIPVLFANVGLNTADHLKANEIKSKCGGQALSTEKLTQSIAVDTGLSLLTGSVLSGASVPLSTTLASKP
jgi:predicted thioredoxin/glutaredoxin